MRIAALYDIHGNLPALDAVLAAMGEVDLVVVGGDLLPGPMPLECLDRLMALDRPVRWLFGNGEVAVLDVLAGREPKAPPRFRAVLEWNAAQVATRRDTIAAWPKTVEVEVPAVGRVLFCHATPRDENELFTRLTPVERLAPMFAGVTADVVVCGHTHMQFDRRAGAWRIANAGSVGMPFGEPGAYWLTIDSDVLLHRVDYDRAAAAERIRAIGYPQADDYVDNYLMRPPAEAQMLAMFEDAGAP
jgi:predicted phosphodiesterase